MGQKLPETFRDIEKISCWVNFSQSKMPISPKTLWKGSSTNPKTWTDYNTACRNIGKIASLRMSKDKYLEEKITGVGLVVGASDVYGVDLDHVIDDSGKIQEDALEIIQAMDSYTEVSPSGHGIHILFSGSCPVTGTKVRVNGKTREMYGERHYLTVTGNIFQNYSEIKERSKQARDVYNKYFKPYKGSDKSSSGSTKKVTVQNIDGNQAIEAIKNHNAEYFRKTLQPEKMVFDNREEFFQYIYHYPLSDFLGVPENTSFCCFFHDDKSPSAIVYRSEADKGKKWLYHCHAENMTLTIKSLVEKTGDFTNEVEALDFLKKCLNVTIKDTKWSRKQQQTIDLILDRMARTDDQSFSALCPTADKNIAYGKSLYLQILILAKSAIFPSKFNQSENVLFYMSISQLTKMAERGSMDKTERWVKTFQYHKMLQALTDDQIPNDLLQKAKRQAVNNHKRISFFIIPSMVIKKLEEVEQQGKKWKQYGYTRKGLSYEMFYRSEGAEVANSLYPQRYKNTGSIETVGTIANARAEARHDAIHEICIELLRKQGYFTEKQVIDQCNSKYWGSVQVKRSIMDIQNTYELTRRKASKALKQRFFIEFEGYPIIYFQE